MEQEIKKEVIKLKRFLGSVRRRNKPIKSKTLRKKVKRARELLEMVVNKKRPTSFKNSKLLTPKKMRTLSIPKPDLDLIE